MRGIDKQTQTRVLTSLNCGVGLKDAAAEHGVSVEVVRQVARTRRTVERRTFLVEESGGVIERHTAEQPERLEDRPQRISDAQRRAAAREALDTVLRKHCMERRDNPILIAPDATPSRKRKKP